MTLKIEQNIPIPSPRGGPGRQTSEETKLALKMKPGDSILCPNEVIYRRIIKALSSHKLSYVSRRTDDGYRVWRVDGRKPKSAFVNHYAAKVRRKAEQLSNGRVAPTL
jgi:hypothetical protein